MASNRSRTDEVWVFVIFFTLGVWEQGEGDELAEEAGEE